MFNRDKLAYSAKIDRSLSGNDKLVLFVLGTYAAPTGEVHINRERISEDASINRRTVYRCIDSLVRSGWLQSERGNHVYRITVPDAEEVLAGGGASSRRSVHHRLELTENEAVRMMTLCQEKEGELTTLLTSGSRIAQKREQELTADADMLIDLQSKLSRFLSAYDWRGADAG